ncbi:MAG: hypothetical protein MRZ79_12000 [Bacteroidia bacterium]|nr:hypothetical protein [Bacteroidia bacterium]
MAKRKLKKVEIIILIGFVNSALVFLGMWLWFKAPNRDIYISKDYEGWVRIAHSVEGAVEIEKLDGVQQIVFPDSGRLMTSTKLEVGWRRDRFFWQGTNELVPSIEKRGDSIYRYVFQASQFSRFYPDLLKTIPAGSDTTLLDGTKIKKDKSNRVNYIPGKKAIQYFYIAPAGKPISFTPPPIEDRDALQSTTDRSIRVDN